MVWLATLFSSRITWIVLVVAAAGFFLWGMLDQAYDRGVNHERSRQALALAAAVGQIQQDHEAALKARGWQDTNEADRARVQQEALKYRLAELAAMPPKELIRTVVKKDESGCSVSEPNLGDAFWLRYKAAGGRPAADPAGAGPMLNEVR